MDVVLHISECDSVADIRPLDLKNGMESESAFIVMWIYFNVLEQTVN